MRKIVLLALLFSPTAAFGAQGQIWLGASGEYRTINIFGQASGVPTYIGITVTPELRYGISNKKSSAYLYGNFGFGSLDNTANGQSLTESYKYRVFALGLGGGYRYFWIRGGVNYHRSQDEVSGTVTRTIDFHGIGGELGLGLRASLGSSTALEIGGTAQFAKFSSQSSSYFQGRRDYLTYAAILGLHFLIPSSTVLPQ